MRLAVHCPNLNHGRRNAPIHFCPSCGGVVGMAVFKKCSYEKHALRRKDRDQFCIDCGLHLKTM